jgi:hypothetical protein
MVCLYLFMQILNCFRPSVLATNSNKRMNDTDENDVKKPKLETTDRCVIKKTALEEVREVISFFIQ